MERLRFIGRIFLFFFLTEQSLTLIQGRTIDSLPRADYKLRSLRSEDFQQTNTVRSADSNQRITKRWAESDAGNGEQDTPENTHDFELIHGKSSNSINDNINRLGVKSSEKAAAMRRKRSSDIASRYLSIDSAEEENEANRESLKSLRSRRSVGQKENVMLARQVDPFHSCIEAKCAGTGGNRYMECVFQQCIASMHGYKQLKRYVHDSPGYFSDKNIGYYNPATKLININRPFSYYQPKEKMEKNNKSTEKKMMKRHDDDDDDVVSAREEKLVEVRRAFNDITDLCVKHDCGPGDNIVQYFRCKHQCTLKRP